MKVWKSSQIILANINNNSNNNRNDNNKNKKNHNFDVMGIKQAHAYVLAGACFSLGLNGMLVRHIKVQMKY